MGRKCQQSCQQVTVSKYPARKGWMLDIKKSVTGKRIRKFFPTELEAWNEGDRLMELLKLHGRMGVENDKNAKSLAGAVREFLTRQSKKSPGYYDLSRRVCRRLTERFSTFDISASELQRWLDAFDVSETTRAGYYRYARMFFRWCHRMGYIERDPSLALEAPRGRARSEILTADEMRDLLALEKPDWEQAALLLGAFAGLRSIEILRMEWGDVDTSSGEVHVRADVTKQTHGFAARIVDFTEPLISRGDIF
ncbi:MAG: tyrosine-type recombinase/integrase, partial [Chthoniobacterales bacterium]